ncbi:TPA: PapB/FocB family fimbrial expression transcriptional regulator [Escherichia coli]|uniref:PapB/FocB family fimbrial expression transcriptional regulator n=1 Tax=Escherichia coli TaxID=562 RepID=UPI0019191844|nr:PapB/FocB family fimbrial expression transcriptional regulator [Escherichia coli]EGJ0179489.1 transcriptional regulator [Escherichia coli]EHI0558234.1 transcriptional regulator [Escherichia coli]EIA0327279.1 transcriptional regulator [Escherichia coli]EIQ0326666.1 transcriptional regulator [Escherichia coli]EJA0972975.1 transcriptional regulator [Escherichia coli]
MKCFWHIYPGRMSKEHFYGLIEISGIHSQRMIGALEDYCVNGEERKEVCAKHNVSQGYFSVCLKKFQMVNKTVAGLLPHYVNFNLK